MKSKKMPVIYDSGWVREPDDDRYDRYDENNYVFNEYCVEHYRKQRKYVTITVRGAMVYTVVVMVVTALMTLLLLDIVSLVMNQ